MNLLFSSNMLLVLLVTLLVYWGVLKKTSHRLFLLSLVSLSLLAYLHPAFAAIALLTAFAAQWASRRSRLDADQRARWFWLSLSLALVLLCAGKYGKSIFTAIQLDGTWAERHLIVPLGISYFVFKLIHYLLDHYRGTLQNDSWLKLVTYLFFFPILPAGPLETFQGLFSKYSQTFQLSLFNHGVRRSLLGYFKKLFLLELMFEPLFGRFIHQFITGASHSPLDPLAYVALMFFKAYIDLSAYTDIAIGLSALFGFRVMENFDFPFLKTNIGEFWRSWHISLSQWCRNNVYFPTFGGTRKVWLATYAAMLTMGLWHAFNLNWATWGLYHGTGLVLWASWNRFKRKHLRLRRIVASAVLQPIFALSTFWFVAFGFSFVAAPDYSQGCRIFLSCLKSVVWIFERSLSWIV